MAIASVIEPSFLVIAKTANVTNMQTIYLDYNSTTPIDPAVLAAMVECHESGFLNPASQHRLGQRARQKIEDARRTICEMLGGETSGMRTDRLIVTSGATESNNLALIGTALAAESLAASGADSAKSSNSNSANFYSKRIIISAIEHPSIVGAAAELARRGYRVDVIKVDSQGVCRLDHLRELVSSPATLVSMMLVNNETGVIQPVASAAKICREFGIPIHTDAVQAVGKISVDFRELDVDLLSFTAHKLHGPRGVGGLMTRPDVVLHPLIHGGFQQSGTRPGTEDVSLMVGMCKSIELFHENPDRVSHLAGLRDRLVALLSAAIPDLVINGEGADRIGHTLNVSFPGVNRQALLMAADFQGLAISTGSACASGSSEPSPVLIAMGLEKEVVEGSIRVSLGVPTTEAEIDLASSRIVNICKDLRS